MDDFTADAFVNRDDPIPLLVVDSVETADLSDSTSDRERKRDRFKTQGQQFKDKLKKAQGKAAEGGSSIQDRLLERLLQQVIPLEDPASRKDGDTSTQDFTVRPSFSLPTMSTNFRRFNSRIGVVFVFQAKAIRLLSWRVPTHTLSFLAVYSFVCLDPYLLSVLPLVLVLLALLIPAFMARHPAQTQTITPQTSSNSSYFTYSTAGPPIAPAPTVKPVKELSKDFFRNMRDLQNSMEDFSQLHDRAIALLTPPTNFSNEPLSSTLFLFTFFSALILFIASHLLPWRFIFLTLGWAITCLGHPTVQRQMLSTHEQHVVPHEEQAKSWLDSWIANDIILDTAPETREVEIFELQYQHSGSGEWQSWLFSSSPYDPLSVERVRSERPRGTRFFEDVLPPKGWEWSEKKWALDLWSREWVEERIITGVEVETEGERWVYDIRYEYEHEQDHDHDHTHTHSRNHSSYSDTHSNSNSRGDGDVSTADSHSYDDGLAYGDGDNDARSGSTRRASGGANANASTTAKLKKGKEKDSSSGSAFGGGGPAKLKKKPPALPSWEEGSEAESEGRGRRGEWRRRRWVRMVKRKWQHRREGSDVS